MAYELVEIDTLRVNQANDRHGEVGSEDLAIAELFRLYEVQMRSLASDIASEGKIYDPPLIMPSDGYYIVFDGNRRITCAKLLLTPNRAPTTELQNFFTNLNRTTERSTLTILTCQIEEDRNIIDNILFRRHTGSQGGVGQLDWNNRAKLNFIERTGRDGGINVASEIEKLLDHAKLLPTGSIPWSTLTRLLSSEEFRNRVGISTAGRNFRTTHDQDAVVNALHRITSDLSNQIITLGNLWNNEGKRAYLDQLENEGVLPKEYERLPPPDERPKTTKISRTKPSRSQLPQTTFIPSEAPHVQWIAAQQRIRAIWQELQSLKLQEYPNAVSALMRILVELSVESYVSEHNLRPPDNLSRKVGAVSQHLRDRAIIDNAYFDELERIRLNDQLISIASMQRYIHSPDFAPMANELRTYWQRLGRFIVAALNR